MSAIPGQENEESAAMERGKHEMKEKRGHTRTEPIPCETNPSGLFGHFIQQVYLIVDAESSASATNAKTSGARRA
jgi:hypothetical protein